MTAPRLVAARPHTGPAPHMRGARVAANGGQGVNGWERGADGVPRFKRSQADDSVGASLVSESEVYRSPDQIRAAAQAEADTATAAGHASIAEDRAQVQQILRERSIQGLTPTSDELRLIAATPLENKREQAPFAEAALFARALTDYDPRAAYAAFETESVQSTSASPFEKIPAPAKIRRTVILDQGFRPIAEIRSDTARDEVNSLATSSNPEFELGQHAARIFPLQPAPVDVWGREGERTMGVTPEARSFDDGLHPDVPNLFTVAPAAEWVPPKPSLVGRLLGR